ncbi:MAG: EAL domain-containing protein [Clostridia bacterium]|nr:EAL domain-containing protein [Clostridia bacterium]
MAVIAIVECVVLIAVVFLSGVFTQLDAEAFRFFDNDASERALALDSRAGLLIRNITNTANAFNADGQEIAQGAGIYLQEVYRHDDLYQELVAKNTAHLIEFLNGNAVSGAFFILNGSNTNKTDSSAHSAVYIRNSAPGVQSDEGENLQLEIGPIAVSREFGITVSNHWALDMQIPDGPDGAYYRNPVDACLEYPHSETVRYGYWSPPGMILPGNPAGICYTLPIMDRAGRPCGVIGFEIALSYFISDYFSTTNLPFSSIFAITGGSERELNTHWVISGNPTAQELLMQDASLPIEPVPGTDLYEAIVPPMGSMYCSVHELTMYSKNSPFASDQWILTGMVQKSVLNETSMQIRNTLFISMAITLGVAFVAIFLLTLLSTRKISGLSKYLNSLSPETADVEIAPTNMREIDELTAAVVQLNKRVSENAKVTSKMMELTQLPLGGFEVADDRDTVTLTEYIYSLLHLNPDEPVTKEAWEKIYTELTSRPAEGYEDVYRYDIENIERLRYGNVLAAAEGMLLHPSMKADPDDTYQYLEPSEQTQKWLRIIEAPTENGKVGMILDVTVDIEELMRLAHELDYDALTHLYNRTAFKREAFKKIKSNPGKVGAMIFSDLDNLKYINDTFGHEMGDKLITTASDMFRRFSESGGIVARIAGDEFAIFLYGLDSKAEVMGIVRKLRHEFQDTYLHTPDGASHRISYSSGVAWYPDDSTDVADLLKLSDYAMYEAKHSDKGSLLEFNEQAYEKNAQTVKGREELRRLLEGSRFNFAFQPIVDLRSTDVYGYEALLRSEIDYFKAPEDILTVARAQSRLGQLESAVIMKALYIVQHNISKIGHRMIFINSGSNQCLSERECDTIKHIYKDILGNIVMELTEAENDDPQKMAAKLTMLRELGMRIALDDFGEGFSNEQRIVAMQPNIVKIDIPLIQGVHDDTGKQKIITNLVSFCHARGIKVAAEGVETEADLETVIRMEMDYAQGLLLGEPRFGFEQLSEATRTLLLDLQDNRDTSHES